MIEIIWSWINQAWLITWHDTVLAIKTSADDVEEWIGSRGFSNDQINWNK
jgi:hypothetical protein